MPIELLNHAPSDPEPRSAVAGTRSPRGPATNLALYSPGHVHLVSETHREGAERTPFAVPAVARFKLLKAEADAGIREFIVGAGHEDLTFLRMGLEAQERGVIAPEVEFVWIVLLRTADTTLDNFRRLPRAMVERVKFSFGQIEVGYPARFESVVREFKALGARKLKVSLLNNFRSGVDYGSVRERIDRAISLGVRELRVNDSIGALRPSDTADLFERLRADYPELVLGLHAHNDNGLALANQIESIRHGANMVEGSLAGYGNREGIPPLELVVKLVHAEGLGFGYPVDVGALNRAARLADDVYLLLPPLFRPGSGLFNRVSNLGPINIPDTIGDPHASRDYFLSYVGLHEDAVRSVLESYGLPRASLDEVTVAEVADEVARRMRGAYAEQRAVYVRLLREIREFYEGAFVRPEVIAEVAAEKLAARAERKSA